MRGNVVDGRWLVARGPRVSLARFAGKELEALRVLRCLGHMDNSTRTTAHSAVLRKSGFPRPSAPAKRVRRLDSGQSG
eukprot:6328689-Alexandrium_andersonii.AAC.1